MSADKATPLTSVASASWTILRSKRSDGRIEQGRFAATRAPAHAPSLASTVLYVVRLRDRGSIRRPRSGCQQERMDRWGTLMRCRCVPDRPRSTRDPAAPDYVGLGELSWGRRVSRIAALPWPGGSLASCCGPGTIVSRPDAPASVDTPPPAGSAVPSGLHPGSLLHGRARRLVG
jgi:hypothetical protein